MKKRSYQIDLEGMNILVTGASKGIGRSIASHLIRNGANVAVHYNSDEKGALSVIDSEEKKDSFTIQADLEKEAEVGKLFYSVESRFKRIDAIVLNAGVFEEHPVDMDTDQWMQIWRRILEVNLNAVGQLVKMGLEHFIKNKNGRFIFIGSRAAFRGETHEFLSYAASKGGMTSLARSVARSFGKQGVKAFVIAPGFTRTQMAQAFIDKYGEKRVLDEIGLNELTTPDDIAPLVALMVGGLLDHATGATIDINAASHIR